jgi:TPR repeat protein
MLHTVLKNESINKMKKNNLMPIFFMSTILLLACHNSKPKEASNSDKLSTDLQEPLKGDMSETTLAKCNTTKIAAEKGDPIAQDFMGNFYLHGQGVKAIDTDSAVVW